MSDVPKDDESNKLNLNQVKQSSRGSLRKDFLQMLSLMVDKRVNIYMMENPDVLTGVFRGFDPGMHHVIISGLETRIGIQPDVLLRLNDVTSINFPHVT